MGDNLGIVKVVDKTGRVRLTGPADRISLAWSPKGDEVWSSTPLGATSLCGKTRTLWSSSGRQDRIVDVARDGRMLFARSSTRREIVGVDTEGKPRNLTWFEWSYPSDISPDGRTVLFDEQTTLTQVFVRKLDGSPAVLLANGKSFAFSPDGRWALMTTQIGAGRLLLVPIGTGEQRVVLGGEQNIQWGSFMPDGNRAVIAGIEPGHGTRLYIIDLPSGTPKPFTPEGVFHGPGHAVSPDGSRIAALGPAGVMRLYPIGPGQPADIPGARPGEFPVRWTRDGRGLYVSKPEMPGRVDILDVATGERRLWKEIVPPDPAGVSQIEPFIVSEDGSAFVYSYRRLIDELDLMTGVR